MKPLTIIVIVFISIVFLSIVPFIGGGNHPSPIEDLNDTPLHSYGNSLAVVGNEFGISDAAHEAHYVTLHLKPEREGVFIAAWASDSLPPTSGKTDKNSEIVFQLLSSAKYNILIDGNRCSYYIYPVGDYYELEC